MNKKLSAKKQISHKVVIFWSMISFVTLAFVVAIIIMFVNAQSTRSINDIRNLYEEEVFQQEGSYYVYVYSKIGITDEQAELDKASDLEELIVTYMTYAKRHSNARRIYGMNVDSFRNNSAVFRSGSTNVVGSARFSSLKINADDIPILMLIENGKVSKAYLTEKEIRDALDKDMNP
ncbi:MAG: hypothetical protein WCZ85_04525 [Bacilli bacterium]